MSALEPSQAVWRIVALDFEPVKVETPLIVGSSDPIIVERIERAASAAGIELERVE